MSPMSESVSASATAFSDTASSSTEPDASSLEKAMHASRVTNLAASMLQSKLHKAESQIDALNAQLATLRSHVRQSDAEKQQLRNTNTDRALRDVLLKKRQYQTQVRNDTSPQVTVDYKDNYSLPRQQQEAHSKSETEAETEKQSKSEDCAQGNENKSHTVQCQQHTSRTSDSTKHSMSLDVNQLHTASTENDIKVKLSEQTAAHVRTDGTPTAHRHFNKPPRDPRHARSSVPVPVPVPVAEEDNKNEENVPTDDKKEEASTDGKDPKIAGLTLIGKLINRIAVLEKKISTTNTNTNNASNYESSRKYKRVISNLNAREHGLVDSTTGINNVLRASMDIGKPYYGFKIIAPNKDYGHQQTQRQQKHGQNQALRFHHRK